MRNMVVLVFVYESHLNTVKYLEILDLLRNELNGPQRLPRSFYFNRLINKQQV